MVVLKEDAHTPVILEVLINNLRILIFKTKI